MERTEYLLFRKTGSSESGKTEIWQVLARNGGYVLGIIKWFGRWRHYVFHPVEDTAYNNGCLRDLMNKLSDLNAKHHGTYTEEKSSTDRICWHCGGAGEKVRIGEKCSESPSGICHDGCEHMLFSSKDDPSDDYNEGFIDGALRIEEFWNSTCKTCGGKFAPKEPPIRDLGNEGD